MTTKTYSVLYAEEVPYYATVEIEAATDAEAIAKATAVTNDDFADTMFHADYDGGVCKRIVHIEDPDGNTIAADVALDGYILRTGGEALRRKIDAAEAMFDALEAQEMAEFDPQASRRKGYFDRARALRQAALGKARGQQ
jgi:hypothetical protein